MNLEHIAQERVQEKLLDEKIVVHGEVPLTFVPAVGPEAWDFAVTRGRLPPTGKFEGGRVILGSVDYPDAALLWTEEGGERYLHQVWVAEDLRGHGAGRKLVEIYKEHIGGPVIWVGPFSPGGLALAHATGRVRPESNPALKRKLLR